LGVGVARDLYLAEQRCRIGGRIGKVLCVCMIRTVWAICPLGWTDWPGNSVMSTAP
jgi:hypothetical protein